MMVNTIVIDSRLTTPINCKTTKSGTPMVVFAVANNIGQHTNFFDVVCFGSTATYAQKYGHKSQKCCISGSMEHRLANGKNYYNIIANRLDFNRDDGSKFKENNNTIKSNE